MAVFAICSARAIPIIEPIVIIVYAHVLGSAIPAVAITAAALAFAILVIRSVI